MNIYLFNYESKQKHSKNNKTAGAEPAGEGLDEWHSMAGCLDSRQIDAEEVVPANNQVKNNNMGMKLSI